jgi:alanine racemase
MSPARNAQGLRTAYIDLDALRHNVRTMRELLQVPHVFAVVKANAYGHGAVVISRAVLESGVDALAVADIDEALELRDAGIDAPILCWIHSKHADFAAAIRARLDIGISRPDQLEAVVDAITSAAASAPALVQFKVETGLSRNGLAPYDWDATFARARELQDAGLISVRGIFSHLSNTTYADDQQAAERFADAVSRLSAAGIDPPYVHLAASGASSKHPELRYTAARLGIALYGLSANHELTAEEIGLRPVMTLQAEVVAVRRVSAGVGVSYDYTYRTSQETSLALLAIGYADGIPREISGKNVEVLIRGERHPIVGRIAMDQVIVDLGSVETSVEPGDQAVLFGDQAKGEPSVADWAEAANTINYEIVSRLGPRITRVGVTP